MSLPKPEPGLVVRYSFLWSHEYDAGREQGAKDRPCVIVLAVTMEGDDSQRVIIVPITHVQPASPDDAIELPTAIKKSLGLDQDQSWIIVSESNDFLWPGPDLKHTSGRSDSPFAYGLLPARFFIEVRRRFVLLERARRSRRIPRTE